MKILFITHADFEKPGYFETWAKNNNYDYSECKPYIGEVLPSISSFDFLVVMGGPQSPLEIEKSPYLKYEIELIKASIQKNYPILGICLGAQLIGEALRAKTERSPHKEIGMYPIEILDEAKMDPIFRKFPEIFDAMHWHNDMPGVTEESKILAGSNGCPRQIIKYAKTIYGFQCHLELTKNLVEDMIANCPDDVKTGMYINTIDELMQINYESINEYLELFLNNFIDSAFDVIN